MNQLLYTAFLLLSCFISLAQSPYQSSAGYRPPRHQTADTTTVRGEKPLTATEVYMLKLYYKKELEQKDRQLEQLNRETSRQKGYIDKLTGEKDALILSNEIFRDSLSTLKQRIATPVMAASTPLPAAQTTYSTPKVTYSTTDVAGVRKSVTTTSGGGYMYSEISPQKAPTVRRTTRSQQVYQLGPRGGCFYYTASGRKEYVDRSLCH